MKEVKIFILFISIAYLVSLKLVKSKLSIGLTECPSYTVIEGDTLAKIAAKYGTSVKDIVSLNNIADENFIQKGQVLKIPCRNSVQPSLENVSIPISQPNDFASQALEKTNYYRKMHQVPDLTLNNELNNVAQRVAHNLLITNIFALSGSKLNGEPLGENLYFDPNGLNPDSIIDCSYSEISKYNFTNGGFSMDTGCFTQLVWKGTTQAGFGIAGNYAVALYFPAGNIEGSFQQNVFRKIN
jgi:LysM repeat protein